MRLKAFLNVAAAVAAVFLSCGPPATQPREYFALRSRGEAVGWISRAELGPRRDGRGTFFATACRLRVRRWADGRGVVDDELAVAAARRPGEPAYYIVGRWPGGEFRYRAGDSWCLRITDEFGNVAESRGERAPSFLTFRGAPLPIPTARDAAGRPVLTRLDVATGRVSRYLGRGSGRAWTGASNGGYVRASFDAEGAVAAYVGPGLTVRCVPEPPRPRGFLYRSPAAVYLPFVLAAGPNATRVALPITARLSRSVHPEDLAGPGQAFVGAAAGGVIDGTFTIEPYLQPPLAAEAADTEAAGGESWPEIQGTGELERLAASRRAAGESVRYVTGLGVFAGNLLAPYDWLEAGGRAMGPPGQPIPTVRVALASSAEPATLITFALSGEPKAEGPGARAMLPEIPGLKSGAELLYEVYYVGAPAGGAAALYDRPARGEPALVYAYGEFLGRTVEGAAACTVPSGAPPNDPRAPAFAQFVALGAAAAAATEDNPPPYEFSFPGPDGPGRATWQGFKTVIIDDESLTCRAFRLEPGSIRAYYTYDGILTRLEWGDYVARLTSLPRPTATGARAEREEVPTAPPEAPAPSPAADEGESE
jgi:hypothetical protein